jgi:hypothetical protein
MFGFMKKKSEYILDLDNASSNGAAKTEPVADNESEVVKETTADNKSEAVKETTAAKKSKVVKETAAAKPIKSEPVKVPVASTNANIPTPAPILTTFAPSYLMPTPTTNRRLPGPNMDGFLNMARQVKKSK